MFGIGQLSNISKSLFFIFPFIPGHHRLLCTLVSFFLMNPPLSDIIVKPHKMWLCPQTCPPATADTTWTSHSLAQKFGIGISVSLPL